MESKNSVAPTTLPDGRSAPTVDNIIRQVSKAELLVGLGQVDEAISTLKEILRLNPDSTHAHMKLKDVFLRAGMRTQAAEECIQLARIFESQGEVGASREYVARAHLLSPATVDPSSAVRTANEAQNRVHPTAPTAAPERSRQPQPEPRTGHEAPRAVSRPEQPAFTSNLAARHGNAQQTAKSPPVAAPSLSGPAPRKPAPEAVQPPLPPRASVTSLPIDRGSPPSKNHLGDLKEPPTNGKPSVAPGPDQSVATVSLQDLQAVRLEAVSADSLSLVGNPVVPARQVIQAPIVTSEPSAKVIESSNEKRRRPRIWFYAAAAAVCLSGAGVQGLFWYDARLDKDYLALQNQYQQIAQANAVAMAQPEIVEYVTTEEAAPSPEPEETQPTKREQDSLDARTSQTQPATQRIAPASKPSELKSAATVAALRPEVTRPEVRQNKPAPPMTSQVAMPDSQVDNRGLAPVGTGVAAAPPPPPASPPPAGRVVVAAEATSKSNPVYPRAAAMAGISGSVSIQVSINERGAVVDARAVSGPPLLRDAAVNAARRWRFKPSTIGGVPVNATKTIVFNFKPDK